MIIRTMSLIPNNTPLLSTKTGENMKFDYISDIHLDFHCTEYRTTHKNFYKDIEAFAKRLLPSKPSPTLLIAGDTGHRFEQDSYLLTVLLRTYSNILIVPGKLHCRLL